jgi:hypothetical protein
MKLIANVPGRYAQRRFKRPVRAMVGRDTSNNKLPLERHGNNHTQTGTSKKMSKNPTSKDRVTGFLTKIRVFAVRKTDDDATYGGTSSRRVIRLPPLFSVRKRTDHAAAAAAAHNIINSSGTVLPT